MRLVAAIVLVTCACAPAAQPEPPVRGVEAAVHSTTPQNARALAPRTPQPHRASRSTARPTLTPSASLSGAWRATQASFTRVRPSTCWGPGRNEVPNVAYWTAHRTAPCGSILVVRGPAGEVDVAVWDRGPYVAGRDLDLSTAAFQAVCGSLSRGVCDVRYRRAAA